MGLQVIKLWQFEKVRHPFILQRYGSTQREDVSLASQILFQVETQAGVVLPSLVTDPAELGADWQKGLVVVFFTPVITANPGTYRGWLTVFLGDEQVPFDHVLLEVSRRPPAF